MIYIQADTEGNIQVVSELQGYIVNPICVIEVLPKDFYNNMNKYKIVNGELVMVEPPNPEDIFNYDLCITELLNRFFYEFKIGCPVEALQIQSLVQSRLKPFKAIAQFNYFNKVQNLYPVEIVDGVDIFDTYNRLIALFAEQNIDLNKYLEEPLKV